MNCKKVLLHLNAYVDGELHGRRKHEIEAHLALCQACHKQLENLMRVNETLDSLEVPSLPQGFAVRVMAEAHRRKTIAIPEKRFYFPLSLRPLQWIEDFSTPMRVAVISAVLLAFVLGMFMSKEFSIPGSRQATIAGTSDLEGLEWFNPTPPASIGSAYLTLASNSSEDGGNP